MKTRNLTQPLVFVLLCGLSALAAGCGSEQDANGPGNLPVGDPVPVSVGTARLSGIASATRAGDESGTDVKADNAKLRLFRTNAGTYSPMYDIASTYSAASSQWTSEQPIYVDSRKATIYACYDPNNVVTFGANSTTTTNILSIGDYDADKMWYFDNSHTAVDCFNASPDFTLKCVYSRLAFNIARDENYPAACKISEVSIRPGSGNFRNGATFDLGTGKLSAAANLASYSKDTKALPMYTAGISADTPDTSIDLMVPSQALTAGSGLKVTLNVDGSEVIATIPPDKFNEFRNSERYTVYLKITSSGLNVGQVTTTDWVPSSGGSFDSKLD